MELEEKFKEETFLESYIPNQNEPKIYNELYVEWLEEYNQKLISLVKDYAPTSTVELDEFDTTKKDDYIYCIEWGMKKAKKREFEVYQLLMEELNEGK